MNRLMKIFAVVCVLLISVSAYAYSTPDETVDQGINPLALGVYENVLLGSESDTNTRIDEQGVIYEFTSDGAVVSGYTEDIKSDIVIPSSMTDNDGFNYHVTGIKEEAFRYCDKIETIEIGFNVLSIGTFAFESCTNLKTVDIISDVDGLKLTQIGNVPFRNCTSLRDINVLDGGNGSTYWSEDGVLYGRAYDSSSSTMKQALIAYPASKTQESYEISENISLIGLWAFDSAVNLKSVLIPSSVETIDGYAFNGCGNLEEITIEEGVKVINTGAFTGCSSVKRITLPKTLETLGMRPFFNCDSIEEITVLDGNENFLVVGGVLYTRDTSELVYYPPKLSYTEYTILEGTRVIRSGAFFRTYNIESLVMPDTVEEIEEYGIRSCTAMTKFNLSNNLTKMGKEPVSFCTSLTHIDIPESLTSLPEGAFYNCSSITDITIPSSVESIGERAFYNCSSLGLIEIPASVTTIGNDAFFGCRENMVIQGEEGSYAEQYALESNYLFNKAKISFITNGGTECDDIIIEPGDIFTAPPDPEKTYFVFDGWYTDKDFKEKWDFTEPVYKSLILYAKWTPVPYKISISDNMITVDLIDDAPKKVFVASYDENGRMIDVITREAATSVLIDELVIENASTIRAYLWSGEEKLIPLCEAAK
jgi:uncharacterized repeat protein (TIGR02543 family)